MAKQQQLDIKAVIEKLAIDARKVGRYRFVIFLVFVVAVYGFVIFRISALDSLQPSAAAISTQSNPILSAHIDPTVVNQLKALRDNNVSVKSLFEQARNNPFQD